MGNICRSPTAEGVFRQLVRQRLPENQLLIDSAGTIAYHVGEHPDRRSIEHALNRGYDLSRLVARQVCADDLERFDLILAMDQNNLDNLQLLARKHGKHDSLPKIQLMLEYAKSESERQVPDPYYGGSQGFDHVIDLIEAASNGLIDYLIAQQHQ